MYSYPYTYDYWVKNPHWVNIPPQWNYHHFKKRTKPKKKRRKK